jgi:muconolactone D-isomerase
MPDRSSFLVRIGFHAEDVPEVVRADVLRAERARGIALRRSGHLERIWRVPGGSDSVSIWSTASTAGLHELLTSLPIAPWSTFQAEPLSPHPLDAEPDATPGAE